MWRSVTVNNEKRRHQSRNCLADVPQPLLASTGVLTRNHPHVGADLFATRKPSRSSDDQHVGDGRKRPHARMRRSVAAPRVTSLHGHYSASLLPLAPPPPSRRPPFSRCRWLYSFLLRGFSPRDEEGFSSCLMCPCHRAVATAPPERLAASVSLQRSMLPSPRHVRFGLWVFWVSR